MTAALTVQKAKAAVHQAKRDHGHGSPEVRAANLALRAARKASQDAAKWL